MQKGGEMFSLRLIVSLVFWSIGTSASLKSDIKNLNIWPKFRWISTHGYCSVYHIYEATTTTTATQNGYRINDILRYATYTHRNNSICDTQHATASATHNMRCIDDKEFSASQSIVHNRWKSDSIANKSFLRNKFFMYRIHFSCSF